MQAGHVGACPISSTNTRVCGLKVDLLLRTRPQRRFSTSGRSCSAACAVFFCASGRAGQRSATACRSRSEARDRPVGCAAPPPSCPRRRMSAAPGATASYSTPSPIQTTRSTPRGLNGSVGSFDPAAVDIQGLTKAVEALAKKWACKPQHLASGRTDPAALARLTARAPAPDQLRLPANRNPVCVTLPLRFGIAHLHEHLSMSRK